MKKKHIMLLSVIVILDQLTKIVIQETMKLNESVNIIPNFFHVTYTLNTGAAWSMLEGKMLFFYIVSFIALIGMYFFYHEAKAKDVLLKLGIVLMMGGTIGNLIDRIVYQHVRDFLDFFIFGYDFPVFNLADTALCIGVFLIIIDVIMEYLQENGVIPYERRNNKN